MHHHGMLDVFGQQPKSDVRRKSKRELQRENREIKEEGAEQSFKK